MVRELERARDGMPADGTAGPPADGREATGAVAASESAQDGGTAVPAGRGRAGRVGALVDRALGGVGRLLAPVEE